MTLNSVMPPLCLYYGVFSKKLDFGAYRITLSESSIYNIRSEIDMGPLITTADPSLHTRYKRFCLDRSTIRLKPDISFFPTRAVNAGNGVDKEGAQGA